MAGALAFGGLAQPQFVHADTVAYEFIGSWENPPASVKTGSDVLGAVWRFDINDDSPAPSNDPVDNNVVTFTARNAKFTAIPEVCLTTGVTPVSTLSADGTVLTCNIGTRDQGTAQVSFTGLVATGTSGDQVSLTGSFLDKTVDLPKIPIVNPFVMDAKFDGASTSTVSGTDQLVSFGWSVSHSTGSLPGPSTVSYDLDFGMTGSTLSTLQIDGSPACVPVGSTYAGYPFSDAAHTQAQSAKFPACTFTKLSSGKFRLTLSNLNYDGPFPTQDSSGANLPTGMDVIASGVMKLKFTYTAAGTVTLKASTPTYIAAGNPAVTSVDDAANNSNARAYTRGVWTHGFNAIGALSQGSVWTDTYRTFAGASVTSGTAVQAAVGNASCVVLDSQYVTFESAKVSSGAAQPAYTGATIWYYTGAITGPNAWTGCETNTPSADGWVSTPPSDLSTVKAVMNVHTQALINQGTSANGLLGLYVSQKIKDTVAVGQDIWSWGSYKLNGTWTSPNRGSTPPTNGAYTLTPNARYPFAAAGRDVLRIIGSAPVVEKEVAQKEAGPGTEVDYTLRYGLSADAGAGAPAQVVLVDTLPAGMAYVTGSSTPAPVITGTVAGGQTLTWTINNVAVNKTPFDSLTFKALVPATATPGTTYNNTVKATSQGQSSTAEAAFVVPKAGYTTLKKTALDPVVPSVDGVAEDGWTVRMTSVDPVASAKTDTIDILPYMGDQRGTDFEGTYKLKQAVQAVAGATVYYTTAAAATLKEDPKDVSNGGFATTTGNTVGWSTTYTANATAVRVIGPGLTFGQSQDFTVRIVTAGSKGGDTFVNTAVGRASDTQLRMRTSDKFEVEVMPAFVLKKYVRDSAGVWHDAQTATDFPPYNLGDTARYRLVVENTGNIDLTNLPLTDTKANLGQLFEAGKLTSDVALEGNAADGVKITLLAPDQTATIEYDMVITEGAIEGTTLINTACVNPETGSTLPAQSCDPAGVKVFSSLAWEKISAYSATTFLDGSEWELIQVTADGGAPVAGATPVAVTDCVAAQGTDCTGADIDPLPGRFKVKSLVEGWYRLVEAKAPTGYKLDATPHFVQVSGVAKIGEGIVNELHEPPMLPLTGGVGTLGFWIGGGLGGLLAAAGLLWQRRRTLMI
ncbi:hypothetical protein MB46_19450 (plasmid) [Arthrobacter alpinus]|nr:hypothetical protein MB46_19450 [Arthrobacter alpinus]